MRATTLLNLLLLLLLAGVVGFAVLQWYNPIVAQSSTALNKPALELPEPVPAAETKRYLSTAARAEYSEIIERPLFLQTRRPPPEEPPPEPVAVVEAAPEPEINLTLIGVMVTPKATTALIRDNDTNKSLALKIGETVADLGWRVAEVKPEQVVLTKNDKSKKLELIRNKRKPDYLVQQDQLAKRIERVKERRLRAQQQREQRRQRGRNDNDNDNDEEDRDEDLTPVDAADGRDPNQAADAVINRRNRLRQTAQGG